MDVRTIPALPCRDLDDVLPFYRALGFRQTYRQTRPNPYLCLSRGDGFDLHFFGLPEFDPENSLGNVIVTVPDTGILYDAGLRRHPDATDAERLPLLVYLAELVLRTGDTDRARAVLKDIEALDTDKSAVADELSELEEQLTD